MNIKIHRIQGQDGYNHEEITYEHHIQLQYSVELTDAELVKRTLVPKAKHAPVNGGIDVTVANNTLQDHEKYLSVTQLENMFKDIISELRYIERDADPALVQAYPPKQMSSTQKPSFGDPTTLIDRDRRESPWQK